MQQRFTLGTLLLVSAIITAPSPIRAENEAAWSAAHEGVLLLAMAGGMQWADFSPEQQLVEKAELAIKTCAADGVLGTPVPLWVREAKALFSVPETKKSVIEEYSEGTNGVLLVRDEKTDAWSQPAFYTIDQALVIESAVSRELTKRGLQEVKVDEHPDLLVHYWLGTKDKQQVQGTTSGPSAGYYGRAGGYYGGGYGWGASYSTVTTYEYTEGTLVVDLVEPVKKELQWRATMVANLEDATEENIELGNKAITKAFENYPPKKKTP